VYSIVELYILQANVAVVYVSCKKDVKTVFVVARLKVDFLVYVGGIDASTNKQNKLRVLSPRATIAAERKPLFGEVSDNFCG
jgi:hypothetical protein